MGSRITEEDINMFTGCSCHLLAAALAARTGWPIMLVADVDGRLGWFHAGVLTPQGRLLDIRGEHDEHDWLDEYGPIADAYGYDLQVEDYSYVYDGDCIQVCPATATAWRDGRLGEVVDSTIAAREGELVGSVLAMCNGRIRHS
ncbi:hypothetical protein EXU48_09905 [Occultella glacieicola]|uniref:Uncharacterized protein n=1 Tax=Occultella glacieicola TaxID=2518684 RepID=A0ABY2E4W9_9MICO|nr:hypothetical protein [Occultella glacieicola]TDE95069.1 hypothetical protein EXU48_09905 [Occultella glacieicola]